MNQSTTHFDALFADSMVLDDQSDILPKRLANISEEPENTMMANSGYNSTRTLKNSAFLNQSHIQNISPDISPRNFSSLVSKTETPMKIFLDQQEIKEEVSPDLNLPQPAASESPAQQRSSPTKPIQAHQHAFGRKDRDKKKPPTVISALDPKSSTRQPSSKLSTTNKPQTGFSSGNRSKLLLNSRAVGSRSASQTKHSNLNVSSNLNTAAAVKGILNMALAKDKKTEVVTVKSQVSGVVAKPYTGPKGVFSPQTKLATQTSSGVTRAKMLSGGKQSVTSEVGAGHSCTESQRSNSFRSFARNGVSFLPVEKLRGVLSSQALKREVRENSQASTQQYKESSVSLSRDDFGSAVQFKSDRGVSPFAANKLSGSVSKTGTTGVIISKKQRIVGIPIRGPLSMKLDNITGTAEKHRGYSGRDATSGVSKDDDLLWDEGANHTDHPENETGSLSVKSSQVRNREFDHRSEHHTIDGTPKKGRMAGSSRKSSYYEHSSHKSANKKLRKSAVGIENYSFGFALSKKTTEPKTTSDRKDSMAFLQQTTETTPSLFSNVSVQGVAIENQEQSSAISTSMVCNQLPKFTKSQALPAQNRSGKDFLALNKRSVKGGMQMFMKTLRDQTKRSVKGNLQQIMSTGQFSKTSSGADRFGSKPITHLTIAPNSWDDSSQDFGPFSSIDDVQQFGHKPANSESWNRKILPGVFSGKFIESGSPKLPKNKVFSPRAALTRQ